MIKFITKMGKRIKSSVSAKKKRGKGDGDDKKSVTSKIKSTAEVVIVNTISVAENVVWLFFIFLLIFMLIIASIVFAVVGSAFGVLSITSATVNNNINIVGGGDITDYNTYDWYGNMTANLLKLRTNQEKNTYRLITMAYQLKNETSDTSKFWTYIAPEYLIGTGMVEGTGFDYFSDTYYWNSDFHSADAYMKYTASDSELNNELDITRHLRYDVWGNLYKWLGDDEYLIKWDKYKPEGYNGKIGSCSVPNDIKLLAQHYMPYTLHMMAYKGTSKGTGGAFDRLYDNYSGTAMTVKTGVQDNSVNAIKEKLKEYGLEGSDTEVNDITRVYSYAGHWSGEVNDTWRKAMLEIAVAAYAAADKNFNNWELEGFKISNQDKLGSQGRSAFYGESMSADNTLGGGIKLKLKGETITKTMIGYLYSKYRNKHSGWDNVKTYLDSATGEHYGTLTMSVGVNIIGHSAIKYIADQCNIVLDSPSVKDWGASTQTVNAMLTLVDKWDKAHNYSTSDPWVAGHTPPSAEQGEDETGTFPVDWCAYTVRSTFQHVKINGSSTTVYDAIRKESGGTAFFTSDFADMGYDAGNTNIYSSTEYGGIGASSIESNKYVAMHFTGNYKGWTRQDPAIDYMGKISKETRYMPKAGDIIIYMLGSGHYSHVGIITGCDGKTVSTIEGNAIYTPDGILSYGRKTKSVDDSTIAFYISIDYEGLEKKYGKPSTSSTNVVNIKDYLNGSSESSLTGSQLVVVKSSGTSAQITALEKVGGKWYSKLSTSGYVGAGGVGQASESTNKTPKGIYYLGKNFGGFGVGMSGLKIGWKDVSSTQSYWGSSNNSNHLNRFYTASKKETNGDEDLTTICKSGAYKYSVLIEYNYSNATKGKGSAFFLHVGSSATAGCVAMSESDMLSVVKWLDKSKSPQILIY